jgi:hypothetical protein
VRIRTAAASRCVVGFCSSPTATRSQPSAPVRDGRGPGRSRGTDPRRPFGARACPVTRENKPNEPGNVASGQSRSFLFSGDAVSLLAKSRDGTGHVIRLCGRVARTSANAGRWRCGMIVGRETTSKGAWCKGRGSRIARGGACSCRVRSHGTVGVAWSGATCGIMAPAFGSRPAGASPRPASVSRSIPAFYGRTVASGRQGQACDRTASAELPGMRRASSMDRSGRSNGRTRAPEKASIALGATRWARPDRGALTTAFNARTRDRVGRSARPRGAATVYPLRSARPSASRRQPQANLPIRRIRSQEGGAAGRRALVGMSKQLSGDSNYLGGRCRPRFSPASCLAEGVFGEPV